MSDPSPDLPADQELKRLRRELKNALAAVAAQESATHQQVKEAVARERRRLAEALHETASQSLTAAYYLAVLLAQTPPVGNPSYTADLTELPELLHRAISELREIAKEFRDPGETTLPP